MPKPRFESPLLFSSGAYAAAVEIERATGRLAGPPARRGRRPRHGRQSAPRRGAGDRRRRPGARANASPRRPSTTRRASRGRPRSPTTSLLTAAEMPPSRPRSWRRRRRTTRSARRASGEAARSGRRPRSRTRSQTRSPRRPARLDPPFTEEKLWRALNAGRDEMKLSNEVTVPAPLEQTWSPLLDVPRVVRALAGRDSRARRRRGRLPRRPKVRLGPVAMEYEGTARLEDVDEDEHVRELPRRGPRAPRSRGRDRHDRRTASFRRRAAPALSSRPICPSRAGPRSSAVA